MSVFEKLVNRFRFLALCCLAYFSNIRFVLPFASWVASAPIPVSLRLGNGVVGLKKKTASEKHWSLFCHLHCCYTTQGRKHPLPLLLLEQLANVHWFDVDVSINHTYQDPHQRICDLFFFDAVSTRKNSQK